MGAVRAGLPTIAGGIKTQRVQIDHSDAGIGQLQPHRQPIGLRLVAGCRQQPDGVVQSSLVEAHIKVVVVAGLPAGQRVDTPPNLDPVRNAVSVQ